jgi:hypothetical protein
VDKDGNAYVTGFTESNQSSFPVKGGPKLTYGGGFYDGFIAKVNPTGTELVYAGYIGGSGQDESFGIAVDAAGSAYVAGRTGSSEGSFPVKGGPALRYSGGTRDAPYDAFVAKVNAAGTGFDYAGYIGGSSGDEGYGVAVDGDGNAYVTGSTTSDESSFPVKGGPSRTYSGTGNLGYGDAFVAKVRADGAATLYAGYVGGAGDDRGAAIAVDSAGSAYIAGSTTSNQATFPVKAGPQLTAQGGRDGFVAKVNPEGTGLVYSGFVGGTGPEDLFGIALNSAGNAYVVGITESHHSSLPTFRGPQTVYEDAGSGGWWDFVVAEVRADGAGFVYLSYVGTNRAPGEGSRPQVFGRGIAVDGAGNAYVVGYTTSASGIPSVLMPALGGPELNARRGGNDMLLAKISARDLVTLELPETAAPGSKITGTVTLDVPAPPGGQPILITSGNRALATPDVDTLTIPEGKQSATFTITTAASTTSQNATITIKDDTFAATKTVTVKP